MTKASGKQSPGSKAAATTRRNISNSRTITQGKPPLSPPESRKQSITIIDDHGRTYTPIQIDVQNGQIFAAWYVDETNHKVWMLAKHFILQVD